MDVKLMGDVSKGQAMSFYHGQIPRIPHGKQNPTKRYLKQDEILTLFNNTVHIQEKVDGKLSCSSVWHDVHGLPRIDMLEDMTGKNTSHKHLEYRTLPIDKRVYLDTIIVKPNGCEVYIPDDDTIRSLDYCIIDGSLLRLEQIYNLLGVLSRMPSHFGRDQIEGLVIKNYNDQLFGKWINDEFEDHIQANQ